MVAAVHKTAVLVVEDDPDLRSFYWTSLTAAGYAVHAVEDGHDALRHIDVGNAPDAVVLDLDLPRVSGHDVYKEFAAHAATSKIPIIVVTGAADISMLNMANLACVLQKPISVDALIYAIENCLNDGATRLL